MKGVYVKFVHGQFVYEYTCTRPRCRRPRFHSSAPELSDPVLCHRCSIGGAKGRRGRAKGRVLKNPRKVAHKHEAS